MLRTRLLTGSAIFSELETDWKELVSASPTCTPFQSFEWQSTWARHYLGRKQPRAYAFYEGDDLVGLYPMFKTLGPWRTLRPMGVGPSDYLAPLSREGYDSEVAGILHDQLQNAKDVDLIDVHQLRENQALASEFRGDPICQATCLVIDLPKTFDEYLQMIGKSLRYDVRKLDKTLFKSGRATIRVIESHDIDRGLGILFEQHKLRWKKRGLPGAFLGKSTHFHRDWARQASERGWLWLSILELDGHPIGAIYAMTMGSTVYYYQAGFDPDHSSVSPGTLLVGQSIRRSIEEGKTQFDLMRGDEPYKRRWKPQHVYKNLRFLAPASGMIGALGSQWNLTGSRLESKVRARLEGRGLL
ncbi:hypothetical protein BH11ARM1_BH11ARM1_12490 [soil metagenome]